MVEAVTGPNNEPVPRVLLVEDNPLHARLVVSMLDEAWPGFDGLTQARRLDDAVRLVAVEPPGCVLLDLVLPDADGLTALEAIVAVDQAVPIVVLSSHADDSLAARALALGAQDYLVKGSVDARQLTRAIRHAVFRQRHREPSAPSNVLDLPLASAGTRAAGDDDRGSGIGVVDRTGVLRYVEPAVGEMLGRPVDQLVGRPLGDLIHLDDLPAWRDELAAVEQNPDERSAVTVRMRHESGTDIPVRVELDALVGGTGTIDAFLARYVPVLGEGTDASGGTYVVMSGWNG